MNIIARAAARGDNEKLLREVIAARVSAIIEIVC